MKDFHAIAWGDRIRDEQLDELLERAKDSQRVILRIDQFRDLVLQAKETRPEAPFPSDREQAGLWRDLVLLDPMDLMVIYGGAENDVVLIGKLKAFIEAKRKEQATPQLHDEGEG